MPRYFALILFVFSFLNPRFVRAELPERDSLHVVGVGSSIIDLVVQVDDAFFAKNVPGKKGGCYPCDPERFDQLIQEIGSFSKIAPGGSAANTVRALAKLGMPCLFSSYVGDDFFGVRYCRDMGSLGVFGLGTDPEFTTIRILCLLSPDGERTFLHCHKIHDWESVLSENFRKAKWVHCEAFLLWGAPQYLELNLQLAREMGATISLDLSSFAVVEQNREKIFEWLHRYVDVVFGNEEEVRVLTGLPIEAGCQMLQGICSIAVVTKGANGCLVGSEGTLIEVPTFPAQVVDTTGAGDYFSAGFIYGRLQGYSLEDCARISNRMGSSIIEFVGTDLPQEKWEEIDSFLKSES